MTLMNDTQLGIAGRLKVARLAANLEQIDLAKAIGVARTTISNWERGVAEPNATAFVRWSRLTGQSIEWLAAGVDVRPEVCCFRT